VSAIGQTGAEDEEVNHGDSSPDSDREAEAESGGEDVLTRRQQEEVRTIVEERLSRGGGVGAWAEVGGEDKHSASFRWTTRRYQEDVKAARGRLGALVEPMSRAHWSAWHQRFEEWVGGLLDRMRGANPDEVKAAELFMATQQYKACRLAFRMYERNQGVVPATMEYEVMLRYIEAIYGDDEEGDSRETAAVTLVEGLSRPSTMQSLDEWVGTVTGAVQSLAMVWKEVRDGRLPSLARTAWRTILASLKETELYGHHREVLRRKPDWELLDKLCASQVRDELARGIGTQEGGHTTVLAVPTPGGGGDKTKPDRRACFVCKKTGHLARDCPSRKPGAGNS